MTGPVAMRNFCTLFDSNYLTRALVMYRSLDGTGEDFRLYALCMDDMAYEVLRALALPRLQAIALRDFETPELLAVKRERSVAEYCWTCTPHVIRHALEAYALADVTYVDADLCFYAPPALLFDEFAASGASVLITGHRYTPRYDLSAKSGIYCVQFMTFKADARGLKALHWWGERCLEWCYARFEDGKFGDQKYLDDWPSRFEGVHVLQHLGGGVAPWNVQQYAVRNEPAGRLTVDGTPVVFYHFHRYHHYADGAHDLGAFRLSRQVVDLIYRPYVRRLEAAQAEIRAVVPGFDRGASTRDHSWRGPLRRLWRRVRGELNEYGNL
jgi:hypothetical protein